MYQRQEEDRRRQEEERQRQVDEDRRHLEMDRRRLSLLEARVRTLGDSRLSYFAHGFSGSNMTKKSEVVTMLTQYGLRCLFCNKGAADGVQVSRAHLVAGVKGIKYNRDFGNPPYVDQLDPTCLRNFIPLCGNHGQVGTCHDAFDSHRVALLYNSLRGEYFVYSLNRQSAEAHSPEIVVTLSNGHVPYRRVLAWRAIYGLQQNAWTFQTEAEYNQLFDMCCFMDQESIVADDESGVDSLYDGEQAPEPAGDD